MLGLRIQPDEGSSLHPVLQRAPGGWLRLLHVAISGCCAASALNRACGRILP